MRTATSHRPFRVVAVVAAVLGSIVATANVATAATVTCGGRAATIVGTEGDDRLTGTPGVDVIAGLGGKDKIFGLDGDDLICGGRGRDRIFGGAGADQIWGNGGNDRIIGQSGRDILRGGNGHDLLLGRSGNDRLYGEGGHDRIRGGRGVDMLDGGSGDDTLDGEHDLDIVLGRLGIDYCEPSADSVTSCELPEVSGQRPEVEYENEMFSLINTERANRGLPLLTRHRDLDRYAVDWAAEMATIPLPLSGSRHHSPAFTGSGYPFRGLPSSVSWTSAYENVGYSTISRSESPEATVDRLFYSPNGFGFMSSTGHRCNILETAVHQVGLGAHVDSNGSVWVVQVFWGTFSPKPAPIAECSEGAHG